MNKCKASLKKPVQKTRILVLDEKTKRRAGPALTMGGKSFYTAGNWKLQRKPISLEPIDAEADK